MIGGDVAALYPGRSLRSYVRWKVKTDPVYDAVYERLQGTNDPIVDVGCGAGVLAAYLRVRGFEAPVTGVDHDARKIEIARGLGLRDAEFIVGQASTWPGRGTIVMLDLLHYFDDEAQASLLHRAAIESNLVIIRDAVRDGSWRYRATYAQEMFARAIRWLKAERLNFPKRETIVDAFAGFDAEIVPLWGRTPFNNYLFVFRRSSAGMTKA
ncbi:MAG: class I SAM-dependent methyltransferase [Acidobacteriota bacterium]